MAARRDSRSVRARSTGPASLVLIIGAVLAFDACLAAVSEAGVDHQTEAAIAMQGNAKRGREQFNRLCARCHGAGASGDAEHGVPVLAGQRSAYLIRQLASFSGEQRESVAMHRVLSAKELQEPQAWADLAAYISSAPVPQVSRTGSGRHLGLGEATYRIQCASCHYEDGRGDVDGLVPSLRNQNYRYLLRQVQRLAEFHRHNIDENIARLLHSLHDDEARGVADYMSRFRGPVDEKKN
jgi:cytochrome c553